MEITEMVGGDRMQWVFITSVIAMIWTLSLWHNFSKPKTKPSDNNYH